jgi:hypothetical protein
VIEDDVIRLERAGERIESALSFSFGGARIEHGDHEIVVPPLSPEIAREEGEVAVVQEGAVAMAVEAEDRNPHVVLGEG